MHTTPLAEAAIGQNLRDAGCDANTMARFFQLRETGGLKSQLKLLAEERSLLLRKVHENQTRLDCLDYLIFQLKKAGEK